MKKIESLDLTQLRNDRRHRKTLAKPLQRGASPK